MSTRQEAVGQLRAANGQPGPRHGRSIATRSRILGLVALAAAAGFSGCSDEAASEPFDFEDEDAPPALYELSLDAPPAERGGASLLGTPATQIDTVLDRLDTTAERESARGLFLRIGPMGGAWGRIEDLRLALAKVRDAGKPVHCHFATADNASFALMAAGCDRISMTPAGDLNLVGLAAQLIYARSLLDNAGMVAELRHVGRYKGAADALTEDQMPATTRESMGALLDDLQADLVKAIADGRNLGRDRVQGLIDSGPLDARDALAGTLIDDIAFDDEAREHARRAADVERVERIGLGGENEPIGLAGLLQALGGDAPDAAPEGDRILVARLTGTIVDGGSQSGQVAAADPFVAAMRRAANDPNIKAVVLRIDSPGGSASASDRMWHAVRGVARHKPVIASVGDMAASGGYYVAAGATEIFAHDTSILGSIGVVGGKITAGDLAERIGVHAEVIARGAHADWLNPLRPFNESEKAILDRQLQRTYDRFIRRVALGRDMERSRVEAGAEGRVWSGRRARELGLVDRVGGLADAISHARQRVGLDADAPIESWPRQRSMLETLAETMGGGSDAQLSSAAQAVVARLGPAAASLADLAAAFLPLWTGRERVLVVLPFAVRVQ